MSPSSNPKRLFVIGLDCFDPNLAFEWWRDDLPNLKALMAASVYGRLSSTVPPITVPAWTCMLSGRDPGEHGFYGFRNRADHSYEQMTIATADKVHYPRIWDWMSEAGRESIVLAVPQTYPVTPIKGLLTSSFLTPSSASAYAHPPEFKTEVEALLGEYMIDVPNFRTNDKVRLLQDIYRLSRQRFDLVEHLLKTKRDWEFMMFVDMGPDRIHHGLWKYIDPKHPRHEQGNPFVNTIHKYYQFIDARIGRLLDMLPDDVAVMVISDHGAQPMMGGLCINDWLIEQGYLTLSYKPQGRTSLAMCEIDWSKTKAWGAGGYYGRLFLNIEGREPEGIIPPNQVDSFKDEITACLEDIVGPDGQPLGTRVLHPDSAYAEIKGIPPDLIIYFGDLAWRSVGTLGNESIYTFENDTGPDDANHAEEGLFILRRPEGVEGTYVERTWKAVAPTMLDLLELQVPHAIDKERLW